MGRPKGSKNKSAVAAKAPLKSSVAVVEVAEDPEELEAAEEVEDDGLSADTPPYTPPPQPQAITADQLATAVAGLSGAVQVLADATPVKKVPFSKYKTRSPFNPTGKKGRKLTRRVFQNYYRVDIKKLHDEEISLLNQIKPGKYLSNIVTIREVLNGSEIDLHILYNNKSQDQKMALKNEFRNFTELLKRCLNEGRSDLQATE